MDQEPYAYDFHNLKFKHFFIVKEICNTGISFTKIRSVLREDDNKDFFVFLNFLMLYSCGVCVCV